MSVGEAVWNPPTRGDGPIRFRADNTPQAQAPGTELIDASEFVSPKHFAREREAVLRRTWLVGCHASEIPDRGDHTVWAAFGELVVIARQDDGTVAAFHNVCQHRGARIVRAGGRSAKSFVCPWHGFVYGLDGTVRGLRVRSGFAAPRLDGLRARRVAVAEWGGFVWINLAGDDAPETFDASLAELDLELAPYQLGAMRLHATGTWTMPCNWKAALGGFLEIYHVSLVHPTVVTTDVMPVDLTQYTLFARNSMMVIPFTATLAELESTGDHQRLGTCHYLLFPNTVLNCTPAGVQVFSFQPDGPSSTTFHLWFLAFTGRGEAYERQLPAALERFRRVVDEDVAVDLEAGATAESMAFRRIMTHQFESRIAHLHGNVNALLRNHIETAGREECGGQVPADG
jgi:phenylpropionate dioxygenase-like ring-hydroxylating dioxygenase large terminal subunit